MSRLVSESIATPDVTPAQPSLEATQPTPPPVLITEQQVVFATAAAASLRPAPPHPRMAARVFAAVRRPYCALPEPRPIYPSCGGAGYSETARMSREMDHL
jgi:hypothetical protein